jgi:hypothetical protein
LGTTGFARGAPSERRISEEGTQVVEERHRICREKEKAPLLKKGFFEISHQPWALIVLLLVFCFIFYFLNLGRFELRGSDETRWTQVAREIVEGGDWISMHYRGVHYWDKPPLFFWTIALSSYLWQGFSSFSARFPSALFGTLTVLLVFLIGKGLYDSKTGFLSGLILATSPAFARFSTRTYIDSPLTFFTTASFFCFLQWYRTTEEGLERRKGRGRVFLLGFYVSMALATLTKGPVGFLIPLAVTLVYLLMRKGSREWTSFGEWSSFLSSYSLGTSLCFSKKGYLTFTKPFLVSQLNTMQRDGIIPSLSIFISSTFPQIFYPGSFSCQERSFTVTRISRLETEKHFCFF